jgi:ribose transport system permease protein
VQWLNDMFSGVALLAAVSFAVWRQRNGLSARARRRLTQADGTPVDPASGQTTLASTSELAKNT